MRRNNLVVRSLERRDLRGFDRAIPNEWMPRRDPDEVIEEPASLDGWSWGAVAPHSFDVEA